MKNRVLTLLASLFLCLGAALFVTGCGSGAAQKGGLADGTYQIEVETDSSMFRSDSCQLTVENGSYTAVLVLPGEGFSKLYFGTVEEAASATEGVYDYHLNDEGKYAFDIPVSTLDEELAVAAFGQRRDTWYDHTIVFHAPADAA
ncbi:MAG: hypothetical protein IJ092_05495 [Atopobiaceae bacterium]|nr:hypothetical protein [Atopobiaceae bacterium]MBR1829527.1 hypothetical protein [Atopobiaceae bacterium]